MNRGHGRYFRKRAPSHGRSSDPAEQTYALRRIELATVSLAIKDWPSGRSPSEGGGVARTSGNLRPVLRSRKLKPRREISTVPSGQRPTHPRQMARGGPDPTRGVFPGQGGVDFRRHTDGHLKFSGTTCARWRSPISPLAQAQRGDVAGSMVTVRQRRECAVARRGTEVISRSSSIPPGRSPTATAALEQRHTVLDSPSLLRTSGSRLLTGLSRPRFNMGDLTRDHQFLGQVEPAKQLLARSSMRHSARQADG